MAGRWTAGCQRGSDLRRLITALAAQSGGLLNCNRLSTRDDAARVSHDAVGADRQTLPDWAEHGPRERG